MACNYSGLRWCRGDYSGAFAFFFCRLLQDFSEQAIRDSNYMTNISPQAKQLNRGAQPPNPNRAANRWSAARGRAK